MTTADALDLSPLLALTDCAVTTPADAGWDVARTSFNLASPPSPVCVVSPATPDAVGAVLRFAAGAGLRVVPQLTGHGAGALAAMDGAILLRTDALTEVSIDAGRRIARAGAGVLWRDVCAPAVEAGLWPLAGSSPGVGVVGYTLGGGLSFLSRTLGLACNSVTAVEIVVPDGTLVRADAEVEPDLFWAVRGGIAPGVVTAVEFVLHEVGEVTAGHLYFPAERGGEVLGVWNDLTGAYPAELATIGRMLQFPPFPEIPEPVRGKAFCIVEVAFRGGPEALEPLLAPIRALGPVMDTVAPGPVAVLGDLHMDPEDPLPYAGGGHRITEALPREAIEAFAAANQAGSPLISLELRHLGGALAEQADGGGALGSLPGKYASFGVGLAAAPPMAEAVAAQLAQVIDALAPHETGRYANFTEHPGDAPLFHDDDTLARLAAVADRFDPEGVMQVSHQPAPAAA